jgi:hypothetical protein
MDFSLKRFGLPSSPFRGGSRDSERPLDYEVRSGFSGPTTPNPGVNAPHQDFGALVSGFVGDIQGVGGKICDMLDVPLDATVKIEGPHRIADRYLNMASGGIRFVVDKISK